MSRKAALSVVGRWMGIAAAAALVLTVRGQAMSHEVGAQGLPAQDHSAASSRSFVAWSMRTDILPYEPLVVDIQFSNRGENAVEVMQLRSHLGVSVHGPAGPVSGQRTQGSARSPLVRVPAGAAYRDRLFLCTGEESPALATPGRYVVRLTYTPGKGAPGLRAEDLPVTVRAPDQTEGEALALILGSLEAWDRIVLQCQHPVDYEGIYEDTLPARLLADYAGTPYGQYARFAASFAGAVSDRDGRAGEATSWLEQLVKAEPSFPLADDCLLLLVGMVHGDNQTARRIELLKRIKAEFPRSPLMAACERSLAMAYLKRRDYEEARAALLRATTGYEEPRGRLRTFVEWLRAEIDRGEEEARRPEAEAVRP